MQKDYIPVEFDDETLTEREIKRSIISVRVSSSNIKEMVFGTVSMPPF